MKPISKTAFYCCGIRMQDAESSNPVCGDTYARAFMNEDGLAIFKAFKNEKSANASSVTRHRVIDDLLRRELLANPNLRVVLIGVGFDSRAYRLEGGIWVELDEPQVIAYKNERLPITTCQNELCRIPIDFSSDSLGDKLSNFSNSEPVVIVIEGIFVYLEEEAIRQLLQTLRHLFPKHKLICDLMSKKFFEKYSRSFHQKIAEVGAIFKFTVDSPETIFLENDYRCTESISVIERAATLGAIKIPRIFLKTLLRPLTQGYTIYVFESY